MNENNFRAWDLTLALAFAGGVNYLRLKAALDACIYQSHTHGQSFQFCCQDNALPFSSTFWPFQTLKAGLLHEATHASNCQSHLRGVPMIRRHQGLQIPLSKIIISLNKLYLKSANVEISNGPDVNYSGENIIVWDVIYIVITITIPI